jgi:hypothetical protein
VKKCNNRSLTLAAREHGVPSSDRQGVGARANSGSRGRLNAQERHLIVRTPAAESIDLNGRCA